VVLIQWRQLCAAAAGALVHAAHIVRCAAGAWAGGLAVRCCRWQRRAQARVRGGTLRRERVAAGAPGRQPRHATHSSCLRLHLCHGGCAMHTSGRKR
jgi:hypothetical protein